MGYGLIVDEVHGEMKRFKVRQWCSKLMERLGTEASKGNKQIGKFRKQPVPVSLAEEQAKGPSYKGQSAPESFLSARLRKDYTTEECGEETCLVENAKLLGGRLVVMVDDWNHKVKLFSLEGKLLCSLKVNGGPFRLAVMDPDIRNRWSWRAAVSIPLKCEIIMMEVTPVSIKRSSSIRMSRQCGAITAVDKSTLAVGYMCGDPVIIDLINMEGAVIQTLCYNIEPWHMCLTEDSRHIIMSTADDTLAKVRLEDGTVVYNKKVLGISKPRSVAPLADGQCVVVECVTDSLHLISRDGYPVRELWRAEEDHFKPQCVCGKEGVCVVGTLDGSLLIFHLF